LKQMKADYLAKAWVLELINENAFGQLDRMILQSGLPLFLDQNEIQISAQSDTFRSKQWSLKNTGKAQSIDLDGLIKFYKVPGRTGEDMNWNSVVQPGKKIRVAILDTGIDLNHPELRDAIYKNESECKALEEYKMCLKQNAVKAKLESKVSSVTDEQIQEMTYPQRFSCIKKFVIDKHPLVDLDGNGYPMDCRGWNIATRPSDEDLLEFVDPVTGQTYPRVIGRPEIADDEGHGTHVAGLIAAKSDNGTGMTGFSRNVEILPIQVLAKNPQQPVKPLSVNLDSMESDERPFFSREDGGLSFLAELTARGVIYAIRSNAQVMNLSIGWPERNDSRYLKQVIQEAISRGIIVVAAAGNDSTRALLNPCSYPGVLCVASYGPDGGFSHFSNYGSGVDIAAPGTNMISTWPMDLPQSFFRETEGYEFLSGTSQAAPLVAAAAAELLAIGIPANEIYPRLILGARPTQRNLNLILNDRPMPPEKDVYSKYILSGNLDLGKSVQIIPQPLVTPHEKTKIVISWDRSQASLLAEVSLINRWKQFSTADFQISVSVKKPSEMSIRPEVVRVIPSEPYGSVWGSGEVRVFKVEMEINDATRVSESRISSDLDLEITTVSEGQQRSFIRQAEILVPLSSDSFPNDAEVLEIDELPTSIETNSSGKPGGIVAGATFVYQPVDENLNGNLKSRDYFAIEVFDTKWAVTLLQQDGLRYRNKGRSILNLGEPLGDVGYRPQILARIDLNNDQRMEYVIGVLDESNQGADGLQFERMLFYVINDQGRLIDQFVHKKDFVGMPYFLTWQKIGSTKKPIWIGGGKEPNKKVTLKDKWENPKGNEDPQIRLYFLDANNKLQAIQKYQDHHIVDIIQPTPQMAAAGKVKLLLAKNQGPKIKPSYLFDFATAEFSNGEISNFKPLGFETELQSYANLLDTFVDRVLSLNPSGDEYTGTYWFGESVDRQLRMTMINSKNNSLLDRQLAAQRSQFDSALKVRAAFSGSKRQGAFVITNSEIEFHNLRGKAISTSFERYTFYPNNWQDDSYFPTTARDSLDSDSLLPALFTTEGSSINRGVRMLVPVFAKDGAKEDQLVELVSPARLRFQSKGGCKSLETPAPNSTGGYAFDYLCGGKILRVPLVF
ncbi:MAG: S8 family serine peptidase, partial [Pseudobdellovibrionaceae bacterium]